MAKKVYAVKKGKTTGIFLTWEECRKNVNGFPGAQYKSFPTLQEAEQYLTQGTGKVSLQSRKNPRAVRLMWTAALMRQRRDILMAVFCSGREKR